MKKAYLVITAVIVCFASITYNQGKVQYSLDKRITALETAQEMATPDIAWVVTAMETMFTLNFFSYETWINNNSSKYLSETGSKAYDSILDELDIIPEITRKESLLTADIKNPPKLIGCHGAGVARKGEPSSLCKYEITMYSLQQAGTKTWHLGNLKFEVTVGALYPNKSDYTLNPTKKLIITDIVLLSYPKGSARAKDE